MLLKTSLSDFKKHFNSNFWKAFKEKVLFYGKEELSTEKKNEIVEKLYDDISKKNYYPSIPRHVLYKEKGHWVPRIIPVFEIRDYCLYYFCIKKLEGKIAWNRTRNTFWGWSLGWLIRDCENREITEQEALVHEMEDEMMNQYDVSVSEYSFNPQAWSKAYWDFNAKLKATIETNSYSHCVEFDIANFYDCINLNLLEIWIRELWDESESEAISLLFHFLWYWNRNNNFYNKNTVWLPQDALADCSRILANFYLQKYDQYISEKCWDNFAYFRYADDQFIFWNSKEALEWIIFQASKCLNKYGLSINPKKITFWETAALFQSRSFELFDLVSGENINDENIKRFVSECVNLYKDNARENLKWKWISLLNKAILLDLNSVQISDRLYLKWLFLDWEFLQQAKPYQLEKLYKLLSDEEKTEFITNLHNFCRDYRYNQFHYSMLQFLENQNIETRQLREIITTLSVA